MKNSNFSDVWTDIILPGSGFELRIQRTYNSRTVFNGLFGFGWCSDYETTLEVTTEDQLRLTECGAGQVVEYQLKGYNPNKVKSTINKIIAGVKKSNKSLTKQKLAELKRELKTNQPLRVALAKRLNMSGEIKEGRTYRANGRDTEYIVFKNSKYVRVLEDGTKHKFNKKGQLTSMYDANSNFLKVDWRKNKIRSVQDNRGRKLSFEYYPSGAQKGHLKRIFGPDKTNATYNFKGENLVGIKNQWGSKYKYSYDKLHNLTKIAYPDKTYKALTYNKDKDLVTSFRHRNGCVESYNYKINKKYKAGHYWSKVKKVCSGKVTNTSSYEFKYKFRKGTNEKYLFQVNSKVNERSSRLTYHPVFGKPTKTVRNGFETRFSYYGNGLVKTKKESYRHFNYRYDKACNKVSVLTTKYFIDKFTKKKKRKTKKLFKTVKSSFKYDKNKCNLKFAKDSSGQAVKLSYDRRGRILKIVDNTKKILNLKYDKKFGKPSYIQRPGIGAINVSYDNNGDIKSVKSKDGPKVATQVATVFNVLLELISPATAELTL